VYEPALLDSLIGPIRNLNWTQLVLAFIVCGLGRGLRSSAMALDEVGSLFGQPFPPRL